MPDYTVALTAEQNAVLTRWVRERNAAPADDPSGPSNTYTAQSLVEELVTHRLRQQGRTQLQADRRTLSRTEVDTILNAR